jgi:signal transduction histidine kinase/CheY-like chemotaxis protein
MPSWTSRPLVRYGGAVAGVLVAAWLRHLLARALGSEFPYATVFLAVVLAGALGGIGPGVTAALAGGLASAIWIIPELAGHGPWSHEQWAGLVRYQIGSLLLGIAIGALGDARRRAEENAERARALEAEARERAEQLARQDRAKDEFLAMLGHELRNPLAPITLSLELMKGQLGEVPAAERLRGIIERNTRDLARIVDDLLEISRINEGKIALRSEPLDLRLCLAEAADATRPLLEARSHSFDLQLPDQPVPVNADATRIVQVAVNLLTNAARYTNPGGRISLNLIEERGEAVFTVRDNGRGIPPELLPRVFDLFVQGDQGLARTEGGLGIGLTLVQRLVAMHGGSIRAESPGPGQGSAFTVRLPLSTAPLAAPSPIPLSDPAPTGRRVLIVEDNRDAAETLREIITDLGHTVAVAGDGPSGIRQAESFHPHLILLDLGLPGMDGYEVARTLRSKGLLDGVTLVALTGYSSTEHQERAREAGFDHYLTKPASIEVVQSLLSDPVPAPLPSR